MINKTLNWKLFTESIGESPINNIDIYNKRMELGWEDKLFFLNYINPDVIVDFGCADGSIIKKMKNYTNADIVGYEPDEKMISLCRSNVGNICELTDNWNQVQNLIKDKKESCVLLSSVIHEVYSYSKTNEIKEFWNEIFSGSFKWVCIRDMMPSKNINNEIGLQNNISSVKSKAPKDLLLSYESIWGKIDNYISLMHFLLKYKYVENWNREVKENYFPITVEDFKSIIPNNYRIVYENHFQLPHHKEQFKKDFGIEINKKTHSKFILLNINNI